jgi:hypothetical protein
MILHTPAFKFVLHPILVSAAQANVKIHALPLSLATSPQAPANPALKAAALVMAPTVQPA